MFVILKSFRNSGIVGGKFLERRRITKPDGSYYEAKDFYVGAVIAVYNQQFVLNDADKYVFNYMEANPDMFPMSNVDLIHSKLRKAVDDPSKLRATFEQLDLDRNNYIGLEEFRQALQELKFDLAEQEVITLLRRYDLDGDGKISYNEFVRALQC